MEFKEKEFKDLANPSAWALFVLMSHREKKSKWQRFIQKRRYRRRHSDYSNDVFEQMVYKLKNAGLLKDKDIGGGKIKRIPTEKGVRAIRNRRIDYDAGWWTERRGAIITRVLSVVAIIISVIALFL